MSKRMFAAVLGVAALLGGLLAAAPAASANPYWKLWNVTSGGIFYVGDSIVGAGELGFTTTIDGNPTTIECQGVNFFAHTVHPPSSQYEALPGDDISLPFTPPTKISSANLSGVNYDVCEDITGTTFGSGVPIDLNTSGAEMTLSFTTPYPGVPGVYTGTMVTRLVVPTDGFTFYDPAMGCGGTGPTTTPSLSSYGSYDTSNALLSLGPTSSPMTSTTGCFVSSTQFSASLTFTPQLSVEL